MTKHTHREDPLNWFSLEQAKLETQLGEPIFVTLNIVYDGYVEVKLMTPDGEYGFSKGWSLEAAVAEAGKMLAMVREYEASLKEIA
jgi:hypothetical protein